VVLHAYRLLIYSYDTITFANSITFPLVYLGIIKEMNLKLKNGSSLRLTKSNFHQLIGMAANSHVKVGGRFKVYKEKNYNVVAFDGKKVITVGGISPIMVEFAKGVHSNIYVNGKSVLDIGAYMGETALYFVIVGHAKKVYTFEPVKSLYDAAAENIKLNKLGNRIKAFNVAIVGKAAGRTGNSFDISNSSFAEATLDDICNKLRIKDAVMKIDCEGFEYGILNNASSATLKRFSSMHIEYHYGYVDLVERLRKEGFEVSYTKPIPTITGLFSGVKYMGDIIAKKR
jgi:FkbM family methyltransferase